MGDEVARTFANFVWDVPISDDAHPPFAGAEVAALVSAMRSAGLDVSEPEDGEYAWDFECRLPHLRMECTLGFVDEPASWLLACIPRRGLGDWLRGRKWEDEQEGFVAQVESVLRADGRVSDLRWLTPGEWDRPAG